VVQHHSTSLFLACRTSRPTHDIPQETRRGVLGDSVSIILTIVGVAVAAFCVWLVVRIVNRCERWPKWTAVGHSDPCASDLSQQLWSSHAACDQFVGVCVDVRSTICLFVARDPLFVVSVGSQYLTRTVVAVRMCCTPTSGAQSRVVSPHIISVELPHVWADLWEN